MEAESILAALIPTWSSVIFLSAYLGYLAVAGSVLPGKIVPGPVLSDGSRLHYRCNGLLSLVLLLALLETGVYMKWMSPTVIADRGLELLSVTFIFILFDLSISIPAACLQRPLFFPVAFTLYAAGLKSKNQSSSLRPHVTGAFIDDWGIARHCNYLGDLLLALSFSLPCGVSSAVPYFYPIYLLILLIWRERRDEARCSHKYKEI